MSLLLKQSRKVQIGTSCAPTNKANTSLDLREPIRAAIGGAPTCDEAAEDQTDDGTQLHHDVVITTIVVLLNAELT